MGECEQELESRVYGVTMPTCSSVLGVWFWVGAPINLSCPEVGQSWFCHPVKHGTPVYLGVLVVPLLSKYTVYFMSWVYECNN